MPAATTQPDCDNDKGVILTIGLLVNGDRCAIVLPLGNPSTVLSVYDASEDAVLSFIASPMSLLLACMTTDSFLAFVQAEPMVDGGLPYRRDSVTGAHPGTVSGHALPSNTGGLMVFYRDPAIGFGSRMRVGKNTVPGVPVSEVVGDIPNSTYVGHLQDFADALQAGFVSITDGASKWYRYLAAPFPRTPGTALKGVTDQQARGYLATQRRRFIPRG